jgi:hypothetical protein
VSPWLRAKLKAAIGQLTAAEAWTMPGLIAKAPAAAVIQEAWKTCRDEWITEPGESVVRDVMRVGGEA